MCVSLSAEADAMHKGSCRCLNIHQPWQQSDAIDEGPLADTSSSADGQNRYDPASRVVEPSGGDLIRDWSAFLAAARHGAAALCEPLQLVKECGGAREQ